MQIRNLMLFCITIGCTEPVAPSAGTSSATNVSPVVREGVDTFFDYSDPCSVDVLHTVTINYSFADSIWTYADSSVETLAYSGQGEGHAYEMRSRRFTSPDSSNSRWTDVLQGRWSVQHEQMTVHDSTMILTHTVGCQGA